jgi:poly(3-hydroxybutyrate) depolymerase
LYFAAASRFGDGVSATNYYPIEATVADWVARNNATATATLERVTATTVCRHHRETADGTKPSAPVTLCTLDPADVYDPVTEIVFGGGHSWPGGLRSPAPASDAPATDFNANTYLWNFFRASPATGGQ